MIQIDSLALSEAFGAYKARDDQPLPVLQPVSRINIFVGSNNSGKSRFMRTLAMEHEYKGGVRGLDLEMIRSNLIQHVSEIQAILAPLGLKDVNGLQIDSLAVRLQSIPRELHFGTDIYKPFRDVFSNMETVGDISSWTSSHGRDIGTADKQRIRDGIARVGTNALAQLSQIPIFSESTAPKRVYIPVLRGLRPLDDAHTDLYTQRTSRDYFSRCDSKACPDIFSGLSLFQRLTDMLLGSNQERRAIAAYQEFISDTLFEGRPIALIPNQHEKVVIVKIGDEKEQPVYNLGDGIQMAIILSFLPYVMNEATFFFIEEPETHLHPGLQRKLLELFASLTNHTFFLTTHSNHLLDITIDIKEAAIFTFMKRLEDGSEDERTATFTIETVDTCNNSSLELLGVRNSSVFLVNATIWVEGITDRWYLRAMLNSYMDYVTQKGSNNTRFEEDVHYSFVEYGGANITHWSFLDYEEHPIEVQRLCSRALVIVDQDGDAKLTRKEDLEKTLQDRLIVLPGREIENLLPYSVIKRVVLEYEGSPDNALPDFDTEDYQDVYLGRFIEEDILEQRVQRRGGYRTESGTVKSKVDFCEKAVKELNYESLASSTQDVIRRIYEFIRANNT